MSGAAAGCLTICTPVRLHNEHGPYIVYGVLSVHRVHGVYNSIVYMVNYAMSWCSMHSGRQINESAGWKGIVQLAHCAIVQLVHCV